MLKEELIKLRRLIKEAEKGESGFSAIYKKLDHIQEIVQDDSSNSQEQCSPANYIKPIKGLLDNYKQSLDRLKTDKTRPALTAKQNKGPAGPASVSRSQYSSTGQRSSRAQQPRSASSHSKSIRELDAEIIMLTREIRNTLR